MRDNICFFINTYESVKKLPTPELRDATYRALFDYAFYGEISDDIDPIADAMLTQVKQLFDKQNEISEKRSQARKKVEQNKSNDDKNISNDNKSISNEIKIEQSGDKCSLNKNKNKNKNKKELSIYAPSSLSSTPPVIQIPLNDGSLYDVEEHQAQEWKELFPAVDVMQELRKMKAWCDANPSKRKTKRGVKAFIVKWLMREQDKGKPVQNHQNERKLPDWYKNDDETYQQASEEEIAEFQKMVEEVGG